VSSSASFIPSALEFKSLEEQEPRRHISVPDVMSILSVRFSTLSFPEMSLIFFPEMTSRAYRFILFAFLLCGLSLLDMA